MNNPSLKTRAKFYSGWTEILIRWIFWIYLGKYLLNRKRYPRITFKALMKRLRKNRKIRKELRPRKIIRLKNHYYTSLIIPHWPSRPFDSMVAHGGLNFNGDVPSNTDNVILAVTRKCRYRCAHCYEHYNLDDADCVPIAKWEEVIESIQKIGASIITFSGGEPMLRYEGVLELLEASDKTLSDFHIHTSGYGVTSEKAGALRRAGLQAAGIGLDDVNAERHDKIRRCEGSYKKAVQAIKCFQNAGVFTYLNMCLTKELVRSGDLEDYYEQAKDLNVGIVRLLEPKPCGGYFLKDTDALFNEDDKRIVTDFYLKTLKDKKYKNFPLISYEAYFEDQKRLGCLMGGHSHFYIDSLGNVNPCVFLSLSFGNIMKEDFFRIFKRMRRSIPAPIYQSCPAADLAGVIRELSSQGKALPIQYDEVEQEWQNMFKRE